ncbi:MAG: DUF488 domain-containing protein [Rubrobacteraceae bacterium]
MLFTIGYEGSDIKTFVAVLKSFDVDTLIDVRDLPLSRKPGFSKKALSLAMGEAGILYLHNRSLGAPKEIRTALRETGDWDSYRESYHHTLLNNDSQIERIAESSSYKKVCLMCFENDYRTCHRSLIAERMETLGYIDRAEHLNPLTEIVDLVV